MKKQNIAFYTLGCKVNQYETNAMAQKFLEAGYEVVNFEENAEIYIINTCTVTNMSDRKSRQILRRVKQKNKNAILVVAGCYAQVAKAELKNIEDIDIIIGNTEKKNIVEYIEEFIKNKNKKENVSDISKEKHIAEFGTVAYTEKTRAVIKVQDGCDMFCSYCIIPYARGRVRSRKKEDIISEITKIAKEGIKEIVITGIHIASYGKDFEEDFKLINLLEEINKIQEIKRIRLGSLEPTIIDEQFIKRLIKLEKICDHFHLSLQSGCDNTLKRMNRKYTTKQFEESIKLLKKAYPNVALTTDIIVGFPGETNKEFENTYKFLDKINFYKMHVFKYSKRKGTMADKMQNQIDGSVKEIRSNKLIELSNKKQIEYNKKYIGKEIKVLLEEKEDNYIKGHTTNYITVYVPYKSKLENEIVNVKIENIYKEGLIGKIANT